MLAKYMLNKTDSPKEKLYILDKLLNLFKATIYRQTMFEEFEKYVYDNTEKDIPLSNEELSNYYYELNKKYFGEGVYIDDDIRYEWQRIPHFYYNFYVYKYATGLSSACYIVNSILSNKPNAKENYIEFLKQGSRKSPNEELKITGVDLTKKETYNEAIKMFSKLVDLYEKTYNEYKRSGE
jgi:oligoendopeptidase F